MFRITTQRLIVPKATRGPSAKIQKLLATGSQPSTFSPPRRARFEALSGAVLFASLPFLRFGREGGWALSGAWAVLLPILTRSSPMSVCHRFTRLLTQQYRTSSFRNRWASRNQKPDSGLILVLIRLELGHEAGALASHATTDDQSIPSYSQSLQASYNPLIALEEFVSSHIISSSRFEQTVS